MEGWEWKVTPKTFAQGTFTGCLIHPWGPFLQQFFLLISHLFCWCSTSQKASLPASDSWRALLLELQSPNWSIWIWFTLQGERHTSLLWCCIQICIKPRSNSFTPVQNKSSSVKVFCVHTQDKVPLVISSMLYRHYGKQDKNFTNISQLREPKPTAAHKEK